ncbi:MAG: hypothetical protein NTU53_02540 [Planctomycetota bacterium]|nr:hypothetical protein [Planctomycetota bacterium]
MDSQYQLLRPMVGSSFNLRFADSACAGNREDRSRAVGGDLDDVILLPAGDTELSIAGVGLPCRLAYLIAFQVNLLDNLAIFLELHGRVIAFGNRDDEATGEFGHSLWIG